MVATVAVGGRSNLPRRYYLLAMMCLRLYRSQTRHVRYAYALLFPPVHGRATRDVIIYRVIIILYLYAVRLLLPFAGKRY